MFSTVRSSRLIYPWYILLASLLFLQYADSWAQAHASNDEPLQEISIDIKKRILNDKLSTIKAEQSVDLSLLKQAELNVQTTRLKLENLKLEQRGAQRDLEVARAEIRRLSTELQGVRPQSQNSNSNLETAARADILKKALETQEQSRTELLSILDVLDKQIKEQEEILTLNDDWYRSLLTIYQSQQSEFLRQQADASRLAYEKKAKALREQLAAKPVVEDTVSLWQRTLLETELLDAEERAQSVMRGVRLKETQTQIEQLTLLINTTQIIQGKSTRLRQLNQELQSIEQTLTGYQELSQNKLKVLNLRLELLPDTSTLSQYDETLVKQAKTILNRLIQQVQTRQTLAKALLSELEPLSNTVKATHEQNTTATLLSRWQLPSSSFEWQVFGNELASFPTEFSNQLRTILQIAKNDIRATTSTHWVAFSMLAGAWFIFMFWTRRKLLNRLQILEKLSKEAATFADSTIRVTLQLIRRNLGFVLLAGLLLIFTSTIKMAPSTSALALSLTFVWLFFKLPLNLAWLLLAAPHVRPQYYSPKLYRHLRWVVILIGALASLTLCIHIMDFSQTVSDVNDTVFMVCLSLLIYPLLKIQQLVMSPLYAYHKGYWILALRIINSVVLLLLVIVSLLGLIGYINLGWALARYLSIFMLVLAGWMIIRGLLGDGVSITKRYAMSSNTDRGRFWGQDIIPLLHKFAELFLFFLTAWLFLFLNGLNTESSGVQQLFSYVLFVLGDSEITLGQLFITGLVLLIVIWLARWSRQITHRWMLTKIQDNGIRHSLSVFIQYFVLLFGGLIALQTLGVQLTALAVFAGAVGVGLGFGLQTIANNFVSGLLLLAERPLRAGDLVNIGGTYEGAVTSIGIRATTIKTWDNQELIVPNSEIISKTFTNWTYSDYIMRTVLKIGVSYRTQMRQAHSILLDTIDSHEGVLKDPKYNVQLDDFGNSAVVFRIYYYVNISTHDRMQVRSDILFNIWDAFEAHGIEIPFPQQDVHLYRQSDD